MERCRERIQALIGAGLVEPVDAHDGARRRILLVATGTKDQRGRGGGRRRRTGRAARNSAHHIRTLEAIEIVKARIEHEGGHVMSVKLESKLRGEALKGRFTARGARFHAFPDAAVVARVVRGGRVREVQIAVEYATSKYTSADIKRKHEGFSQYSRAFWFVDNARTAERVAMLTGERCSILS